MEDSSLVVHTAVWLCYLSLSSSFEEASWWYFCLLGSPGEWIFLFNAWREKRHALQIIGSLGQLKNVGTYTKNLLGPRLNHR
jgi:hypothetical protein